MSIANTNGISVAVKSFFLPEQSNTAIGRYAFGYAVTIENRGAETVQLRSRHWVITDANQKIEEVRGLGVVGEQPVLHPSERFEYTSGCVLRTPWGTMGGSYQMVRPDGSSFDAEIGTFLLASSFVTTASAPS